MSTQTTGGGSTTSFSNTPQATDNSYYYDDLVANLQGYVILDVMSDDLGGKAKVLWSIDDNDSASTATKIYAPVDLLLNDSVTASGYSAWETTEHGARIAITVDGRIAFDANTATFQAYLAALPEGAEVAETFTYAIRLGDGTLSWATVDVYFEGVNDAPTSTDDSQTTAEDTTLVLALSDFGTFADVDGDSIQAVKITTLESNGSLQYDITGLGAWADVTADQVITAADITAGRLRFVPDLNENGSPYATVGFHVSDGTAFSVAENTLTLNVTAVNDAPAGSDVTKNITEDGFATFAAADFGFTDPDAGDTLQGVKITSLPSGSDGILLLNGAAVSAGQIIATADIANLMFAPVNKTANYAASFTVQVEDQSGALDPVANTVTINVTADDDASVIVGPSNLQYDPASDDQTPFNRIMFADADTTGSVMVTITRTAGDGTFTPTGTPAGGTAVTSGGGANITLTGTIIAINAWLAGNNLTLDSQGNDDDTYTIAISSASKTGFTAADIIFTGTGGANTNNYAGVNVFESGLDSDNGSDSVYTSWSHVGISATSYLGGAGGGSPTDTIYLIFTPSQLQEILTNTTFRDDLQPFLSTPTGDTLSLDTSEWRANASGFETANIELANLWSTRDTATPSNNYININDTWKSVITSTEIVGLAGTGGSDLVIANGAGTVLGDLGNDVLVALDGGNTLNGEGGSDLLLGGDGADRLIGGLGNDMLAGGKGADTYKWGASAGIEAPGAANADTIVDYNYMDGDKLDLSALIDANFEAGDNINNFISVQGSGNNITVSVDPNGAGIFSLAYTLIGVNTTSISDPVLIYLEGHNHVFTV
jgi:VCBS repeat-containing protein